MKVVIAGGSGLIGTALATALLEAGHEPVVLSRHGPRAGAPANNPSTTAVRHATWDPAQPGEPLFFRGQLGVTGHRLAHHHF